MDLTAKELAKMVGCSKGTVEVYTCRPEFRSIKVIHGVYYGVTDYDILRLKQLYHNAMYKRGRLKND